jgi:thioredoxin reductase
MAPRDPDVDIAIVGAGPKGASLALHLYRRGVRNLVMLERDAAVGTWDSRYAGTSPTRTGMYFSDTVVPGDSDLGPLHHYARTHPGMSVELHQRDELPKEVLQDYYRDVLTSAEVPLSTNTSVAELSELRGGGARLLTTTGEELTARIVVDATGIVWSKNWPQWAKDLAPYRCFHSIGHGTLSVVAGRRILVIGGGHATPDIAVRLAERGALVTVVVRRSRLQQQLLPYGHQFINSTFQSTYRRSGPAARYRLLCHARRCGPWVTPRSFRDLVDFMRTPTPGSGGRVEVLLDCTVDVVRADDEAIHGHFSNGRRGSYDYVVCATGFSASLPTRTAFRWPPGFWRDRVLGGFPLVDDEYRLAGAPWAYVLGYLAQLGPRGPVDAILHDSQTTTAVIAESIMNSLPRTGAASASGHRSAARRPS